MTLAEVLPTDPAAAPKALAAMGAEADRQLRDWDWKAALDGRPMTWLAKATGKAYRTVCDYAYDVTEPPIDWLREVARLLG